MINLTNKADLNLEDIQKIKDILEKPYDERMKNELELRASVSRLEKSTTTNIDENKAIEIRQLFYKKNFRYIPDNTLYL